MKPVLLVQLIKLGKAVKFIEIISGSETETETRRNVLFPKDSS